MSRIVACTNWQNAIRQSDLMANERRQIEIEREFRKQGYLYLRKRQSKSEAKRHAGGKYYYAIKKEELATAVAGCNLDPVIVRSGKENLFEEDLYPVIFPHSDPLYYLTRYMLFREVTYCAKGYPQRGYAKWLVLGFVWSFLSPLVRSAGKADRFRDLCQRQRGELVRPLYQAIDQAFVAAIRYYRRNSGSGETAVDVSTFFRSKKGRHVEFRKFWESRHNKNRQNFSHCWRKVESTIAQSDEE